MICNSYKSFFKMLSDECRINIINLLSKKSMTVSELAERLEYEQSRVSHALKSLKEHGFVVSTICGKNREYALEKKIMVPLLKLIDKHVQRYHSSKCMCKGTKWREMN